MDLYEKVSYAASRNVTTAYSTSFSKSITLFDKTIRKHIYAIYGLVRIADEIVDTYQGSDQMEILNSLEKEVYQAIDRGYSTNPVVHCFALTAKMYGIDQSIVRPFFYSMAMDVRKTTYTKQNYEKYIYGSAEVIGLMCLRVFVYNETELYEKLQSGARALGAAYQKINFLRDMAVDYKELHRLYFPGVKYESFSDTDKKSIIQGINKDIVAAKTALIALPKTSRYAVEMSLTYYVMLLEKIERTPIDILKNKRIRIHDAKKLLLLLRATAKRKIRNA